MEVRKVGNPSPDSVKWQLCYPILLRTPTEVVFSRIADALGPQTSAGMRLFVSRDIDQDKGYVIATKREVTPLNCYTMYVQLDSISSLECAIEEEWALCKVNTSRQRKVG